MEGPTDARVTLVEYGDFECPHCGHAFPIVEKIRQRLGERLRFVYRHFPLSEMHPHAELAAEAAEDAGEQGMFWEMHRELFTHQAALDTPHIERYAEELGLNMPRFDSGLRMHAFRPRVREDFMSGARSGVNGTPTFFINGERFDGMPTYGDLIRALEEAMEAFDD
jgi:protein-disulfide isomerase